MAKNPCFCMSLRTGAMLIGILEIALSLMGLLVTGLGMGGLGFVHSLGNDTLMSNITLEIHHENPELHLDQLDSEKIYKGLMVIMGLMCALFTLQIVFGGLLIHGIRLERPPLLRIWMIFKGSVFVVGLLLTISSVVVEKKRMVSFGDLAFEVFSNLISIYFIYVVYCLFKNIQNELQHRPKPMHNQKYGY